MHISSRMDSDTIYVVEKKVGQVWQPLQFIQYKTSVQEAYQTLDVVKQSYLGEFRLAPYHRKEVSKNG